MAERPGGEIFKKMLAELLHPVVPSSAVYYRIIRSIPWVIAAIVTVAAFTWHELSKLRVQPFESWLFDKRVTAALHKQAPTKHIGVVTLDDASIAAFKDKGWPWPLPRYVYGVVVEELVAQGADAVVFDMAFEKPGPRGHDEQMQTVLGARVPPHLSSDEYFGLAMELNGTAVVGVRAFRGQAPLSTVPVIAEGAAAIGHMRGYADADDIMRHVDPHVSRADGTRVWQLGMQAVAARMGLDLACTREEPATWWHGRRLVIPKADGGTLTVPLEDSGQLLVHWSIGLGAASFPQPQATPFSRLFVSGLNRQAARKPPPQAWTDQIVFVGATGGVPVDRVNTPFRAWVPGSAVHMNVAESLLTGRFNWTLPAAGMILLLAGIAAFATYVTWHFRVEWATLCVLLIAAGYAWFTDVAYETWLLNLPMLSPIVGAAGASYLSVLGFRMIVERGHAHRVQNLFGRLVAPDVIQILMEQRTLPWDTTQRNLTVLFADIRGFTSYTAEQDLRASAEIERRGLSGDAAMACRNAYAATSLATVNLYLTTIVDAVKQHGGTLDKYIGDCVMAFWGAPVADAHQACHAVRAAISAQRKVRLLNIRREQGDNGRAIAGARHVTPHPPLPTLTLGIAIHTGEMIVGFMGSERHLSNYTVFGKSVNIASRIEKFAEGGTIVTTSATFEAVRAVDPALAESMTLKGEVGVKGIMEKLALYEIRERGSELQA